MELMKAEMIAGCYGNVMDSREIAERTGKEHAHVCRDIRNMFDALTKTNPDLDRSEKMVEEPYHRSDRTQYKYLKPSAIESFVGFKDPSAASEENCRSVYFGRNGEERRCYLLPKRECMILASGYSVKLRAAIIDRWAELEASVPFRPAMPLPRTLSEALRFAADLQDKIEASRPAVEFVAKFVEASATQPLRAVAKVLKVNERAFVAKLIEEGILYRLAGKLTPAAQHMDAGRFEVKEIVAKNDHATTQMRFTTKGVEWIAGKVQDWNLGNGKA